jgi:EAL domain-containing protein (putative c-di-GMP-specific phosphodiesterase class I)
MQTALEHRVQMETWLRQAIPEQLRLVYQLQADQQKRVFGAEALIRWHHPEQGLISPASFIPLAETTGLILPIGRWVLESVCRQLKEWENNGLTQHLIVSVNVSATQFQQDNFVDQVLDVVDQTGARPDRLKLELTESMLIENTEATIAKMNALKEKGISFSLDDFGTGYSSLSYLKQLPLDQIKIDQSFIRDILTDPNDAAIVRTIIALGRTLGLNVVAEGVETGRQLDLLSAYGCYNFQGYLFGKPVAVDEFMQQLLKN